MRLKALLLAGSLAVFFACSPETHGVEIHWTDWLGSSPADNGFVVNGQIVMPSTTLNVTYHNYNRYQDLAFVQTGAPGENDYWAPRDSNSPFVSALVDNGPSGTDMIALHRAGWQTITFSQEVATPVFSYVSLNENGYAFDQDFEVLSFGPGYWGTGESYKETVETSPGVFEYRLLGTGEPHGTIRFTGNFSSVTWRSMMPEYWNGFTIGIGEIEADTFTRTSARAFSVPDLTNSLGLLASSFGLLIVFRRCR